MTGPRRRLSHELAEELISASLTGDLSAGEAADLAAHLAACERCTATAAAWGDSRRLLSGIRHVSAPRDLGARVRTGIEGGRLMDVPWYRRPIVAVASVGALAAAALVLAVIVSLPEAPPPAGSASPLPSGASPSVSASAEATATPAGSASVEPTPEPPVAPLPPDYRIEYAFDVPGDITQGSTVKVVEQASGDVVRTLTPGNEILAGLPIGAELSPDGSWLALRLFQDGKGTELVYAVHLEGDEVALLGESAGDPFAQRLLWSPDGRFLVTTLVAPDAGDANVTGFDRQTGDVVRLTGTGDAYAASWQGDILWISSASGASSNQFSLAGGLGGEGELGTTTPAVQDVFLPTFSPDGETVIFWRGPMEQSGAGWAFTSGGVLNLASSAYLAGSTEDVSALFVTAPGPIAAAQVSWAADSDAYAVWGLGYVESEGDPRSVYFGHLSREDGRLTQRQLLDQNDVPDGATVIDVALAPDGRHLALTVTYPIPGDLAQPVAELLLVTRNFGDQADAVERLGPSEVWVGPGIYAP